MKCFCKKYNKQAGSEEIMPHMIMFVLHNLIIAVAGGKQKNKNKVSNDREWCFINTS